MKRLRKALPAISAALCVGCVALMLLDWIMPGWSLLLMFGVKLYLLVCCLGVIVASASMIAADRRRQRRRNRAKQA